MTTRPQPRVEAVIAWCTACVTSTSDLSEPDAHRWAADHSRQNHHRTCVRVRTLTSYPDPEGPRP